MAVLQMKFNDPLCKETIEKSVLKVNRTLKNAGLCPEIIGTKVIAGLLAADVAKKTKSDSKDPSKCQVSADEAFEVFDISGNGKIERGDIETFLTLAGYDVAEISKLSGDVMDNADVNDDGSLDRQEWRALWSKIEGFYEIQSEAELAEIKSQIVAKYGREGPTDVPLYAFGATRTFFNRPMYPLKPDSERPEADCIFFGSPFDASVTYRTGARFGPSAVRAASLMTGFGYAPWLDRDFTGMKIYDGGDAPATPFDIHTAMNQVYLYAARLWEKSKKLVGIGGDHMLTWCFLRAARDFNEGKPVALIHIDSHLDIGNVYMGSEMSHGTALRRAMDDGCIDLEHSIHIGIHGSSGDKKLFEESKAQGWQMITLDDFTAMGPLVAAQKVKERVGDRPCVISLDVDVLEPGECPGIGFPEPGGMRSRELFKFMRGLKGVKCLGGEVCEFTPEYDSNQVTAHACAQGAYEIMCLALEDLK